MTRAMGQKKQILRPTPEQIQALFADPQQVWRWAKRLPANTALYFSPVLYYVEDRFGWGNNLRGRLTTDRTPMLEDEDTEARYPLAGFSMKGGAIAIYYEQANGHSYFTEVWRNAVKVPEWVTHWVRLMMLSTPRQENGRYTRQNILECLEACMKARDEV